MRRVPIIRDARMKRFIIFAVVALCGGIWLSIAIAIEDAGVSRRDSAFMASIGITVAIAASVVATWIAGDED